MIIISGNTNGKFKVGDCIYSKDKSFIDSCPCFGTITIVKSYRYKIAWHDKCSETTSERIEDIDRYFVKISHAKLVALSL